MVHTGLPIIRYGDFMRRRHHENEEEELDEIEGLLHQILDAIQALSPTTASSLTLRLRGKDITDMQITTSQHEVVTLSATDAAGNQAPVTGITWAGSDYTVGQVDVAADSLSADIISVAVGSFDITVSAVASDGSVLTASAHVDVVADPAVTLTIVEGTPEAK